jgi:AraC-type DNA-binding domain-containing proteins
MKHEGYNETRQRGRFDFPIEFHSVTARHPRYNMPYHWHLEYELIRILHGKFSFSLNETYIEADAGDIIFIRDGIVHGGAPQDSSCIYECIVFNMQSFLKNNNICKKETQNILEHNLLIDYRFTEKTPAIHKTIWQLFDSMKQAAPGYELIVQGSLYHFLGLIIQEKRYTAANDYAFKGNHKHIHQLKQAFKLIDSSYASSISLDQLANAAGLSPKYFCKFFQKMTHRTPIDYLNYYRIEIACGKLSSSDLSITEIAYDCGFNDLSYFIKTFKKYKGTTPNKYMAVFAMQEKGAL